jgi:hypothetical protein
MMEQGLWERLVRRAYPAHKLAGVLGRDVKEIGRWCEGAVPHNFAAIVSSVLEQVPEQVFAGLAQLPTGWVCVAVCDGGFCAKRNWLELRDAVLTLDQALLLDRLGYGVLMHRPYGVVGNTRQFALDFHLLRGRVSRWAV